MEGTEAGRKLFHVLMEAEAEDREFALVGQDILDAKRRLVSRHPAVGALVPEWANKPPHAAALQEAPRLPVCDVFTLVSWSTAGCGPAGSDRRAAPMRRCCAA